MPCERAYGAPVPSSMEREMRTVPTIVIDEQTLLREGITSLLRDTAYKVVASVASVSEIPELKLPPEPPTLAILGLRGRLDETLQAVQSLRKIIRGGKIVAISERYGHRDFNEFLNSGVDGIIFNVSSGETLLKVLELALLGQQVVILDQTARSGPHHREAPLIAPADGTTITARKPETEAGSIEMNIGTRLAFLLSAQLSNREQQVLVRVARGEANKTIARSCSISETTVKAHVKAILRKISVRNRTQAALWAVENGLLSDRNLPDHDGRVKHPGLHQDFR
jgi:two-component system, NarL family, nitrate/nitrite response regulator NarL